MTAEILCVGTEILLGDIVNTNATYISQKLAEKGINVFHHSVVGDNPERLEKSLAIAVDRSDLVITTGGLGPTYDDLTKEIISRHFGRRLVQDAGAMRDLEGYFSHRDMTENNKKQAMIPEGGIVLANHNGTAPGVVIEDPAGAPVKTVIMLPGPPREVRSIWEEEVEPYLAGRTNEVIVSHTVKLFGIGESTMDAMLHDYLVSHTNPTVAPYAKDGECFLRITGKAESREAAEALCAPVVKEVAQRLEKHVYGIDVPNLETALVRYLKEKGLTVACAESFTGGLIAKRITDIAGASDVLGYGLCTYSNDAKEKLLGVRPETIAEYGAVSEDTAREMAEGLRALSGADIAVATTGVAGPDPSEGKAVGTCYIAVSSSRGTTVTAPNMFYRHHTDARELIRFYGASHALNLVRLEAAQL